MPNTTAMIRKAIRTGAIVLIGRKLPDKPVKPAKKGGK